MVNSGPLVDGLPVVWEAFDETHNGAVSVLAEKTRIVEESFLYEIGKELKAPQVNLESVSSIFLRRQSGPSELLPDVKRIILDQSLEPCADRIDVLQDLCHVHSVDEGLRDCILSTLDVLEVLEELA